MGVERVDDSELNRMTWMHLVFAPLAPVGMLLGVYMLFQSWTAAVAAAAAVVAADVAFVCIAIRKKTPVGQAYCRLLARWRTREA